MLSDKQKLKLKQAILEGKVSDKTTLSVFNMVSDLEEKVDTISKELKDEVEKAISDVKQNNTDIPEILREILPRIKGDKGDTPKVGVDFEQPKDGENYILTENDKRQIASSIKVPIVKQIVEKTETIVEQPIINNEIKEVAKYEDRLQIVEKINTGKKNDLKIELEQIAGTDKFKKGITDWALGVLDQRTQFLINKTATTSSGGGHTIQDEGSSLTQRTNLNFVGAGVTVTDGGAGTNSTIVTIPGGGSSVSFGSATQIPFMNAGATDFSYSSNFNWIDADSQLAIGANTLFAGNSGYLMGITGSTNGYIASGIQNESTGSNASTDFIVSADNDNNAIAGHYGDFGINGSGFSAASSGVIKTVSKNAGGTGYTVGDILTLTAGDGTAQVRVLTVSAGAVLTVEIVSNGSTYTVASSATTGGTGSGCTINVLSLYDYTGMVADDTYLLGVGGNLILGSDDTVASKGVKFFTNGFGTSQLRASISSAGFMGVGLTAATTPATIMHVEQNSGFGANVAGYTGATSVYTLFLGKTTITTAQTAVGGLVITAGYLADVEQSLSGTQNLTFTLGLNAVALIKSSDTATYTNGTIGAGAYLSRYEGNGSITTISGISTTIERNNTGNVTNMIAYDTTSTQQTNATSGTITTHIMYRATKPVGKAGMTFTNLYGVYIDDQYPTLGTKTNTAYGIYQAGTTNNYNYFGAFTGFGSGNTVPTTVVDILAADNSTAVTIKINATQANVTAADTFIDFRSTSGSEGSIAGTAVAGVIAYNTFTGSHYTIIENRGKLQVGMLLETTGEKIDASVFNKKQQVKKRIMGKRMADSYSSFGEYQGQKEEEYFIREDITTEDMASSKGQITKSKICSTIKSPRAIGVYGGTDKEGRDMILSIGTGFINVANKGADILMGDYLVSSDVLGCAEKQDDDIYRNYTVAKAMEDIIWGIGETTRQIACMYEGG